jgi:hypothetical protein
MFLQRLLLAALTAAICLCGFLAGGAISQESKRDADPNEGKKGKAVGTLTDKSDKFIEVKADGEEKARRYVPRWVGGAPADGGGPDKAMVKIFNGLKVGSRIEVDWEYEERFRAVRVRVLALPKEKDAK